MIIHWFDNFVIRCRNSFSTSLDRVLYDIADFGKLESIFGVIIFCWFLKTQVILTTGAYLSVSSFLASKTIDNSYYLKFIAMSCNICGILLISYVMVTSIEATFSVMQENKNKLQDKLKIETNKKERQKIKYFLTKMDNLQPITAAGFFTVSRDLFTSMFSTR